MNTLSIVVIAIFALMVLAGLKTGLIKMIFSMISFVVSLALAIVLTYMFSQTFQTGIKATAIFFIVIFVAANIILLILCFSMDLVSKLPVINSCNHIGGALLAAAQALFIIWVFFAIVSAMPQYSFCSEVIKQAKENPIMNLLYENNFVDDLFRKYVWAEIEKGKDLLKK